MRAVDTKMRYRHVKVKKDAKDINLKLIATDTLEEKTCINDVGSSQYGQSNDSMELANESTLGRTCG